MPPSRAGVGALSSAWLFSLWAMCSSSPAYYPVTMVLVNVRHGHRSPSRKLDGCFSPGARCWRGRICIDCRGCPGSPLHVYLSISELGVPLFRVMKFHGAGLISLRFYDTGRPSSLVPLRLADQRSRTRRALLPPDASWPSPGAGLDEPRCPWGRFASHRWLLGLFACLSSCPHRRLCLTPAPVAFSPRCRVGWSMVHTHGRTSGRRRSPSRLCAGVRMSVGQETSPGS